MSYVSVIKNLYARNVGLEEKMKRYIRGLERETEIFRLIEKLSDEDAVIDQDDVRILRGYNVLVSPSRRRKNVKKEDGSFVAISDFHSYRYALDKVKKYYINEYDKVYILGDATDRGKKGDGTGGISLLIDIMKLCKENPGKVVYIPGNHDEFIIGYIRNMFNYEAGLRYNGGMKTIEDLEDLKNNNRELFDELVDWLGNLPIQRTHTHNGCEYVLGHAKFNQRLYDIDPDFSLNKYFKQDRYSDLRRMAKEVLWFRKSNDGYFTEEMPTADKKMIVGHTHQDRTGERDMDLIDDNGDVVEVYCVDGGIAYGGKMFKYDGGESQHTTAVYYHRNTSDREKGYFDDEQEDTFEISEEERKEIIYQDYILSKVLCGGINGFNDVLNGYCPKQIGIAGRDEIVENGYDGNFYRDKNEKRETYVKTFLLDYLFECQYEGFMSKGYDVEDAKYQAMTLVDMYLFGINDKKYVAENGDPKGDLTCFTTHRNARKIASILGSTGMMDVLSEHCVDSFTEYVSEKYVKSADGKSYVKVDNK